MKNYCFQQPELPLSYLFFALTAREENVLFENMSRNTFGLVMQICWCQGQTGPRRPQSLWIKRPSWLLTVTLVHKYKKVNKIYTLCHGYNFIRSFASNSEMEFALKWSLRLFQKNIHPPAKSLDAADVNRFANLNLKFK